MKNKIKNICKELMKINKYKKEEIKKIILKSVIQNLNSKPKIRSLALKKLINIQTLSSISKQKSNICLQTGRYKGGLKKIQISRHHIKKLGSIGSLQNYKISSW